MEMSIQFITESSEALKKAGADKRAHEIHRIAGLWLNRRFRPRKDGIRFLKKEAGFPEKMSGMILDRLFKKFTPVALQKAAALDTPFSRTDKLAGLVVPSNVPDPLVVHTLLALAQGCAVYVKISERARGFGTVFLESLQASPLLGPAVGFTFSKKNFLDAAPFMDSAAVFGNDATVGSVQRQLKSIRFTGYGHRTSAVIIFRSALSEKRISRTAAGLALDAWLYDQRGCLSPRLVLVQGDAAPLAESVDRALRDLRKSYGSPRRPHSIQVERRIFADRVRALALDPRQAQILSRTGSPSLIYRLKKSAVPGATGEVLGVCEFKTFDEACQKIKTLDGVLQGVAVGGSAEEMKNTAMWFKKAGVKRVSRVGKLQDPKLHELL